MTSVGANGEYWASSTRAAGNVNASSVYFIASDVNPFGNPNRANGFSVRCVQHLCELCSSVKSVRYSEERNDLPESGMAGATASVSVIADSAIR